MSSLGNRQAQWGRKRKKCDLDIKRVCLRSLITRGLPGLIAGANCKLAEFPWRR